MCFRSSAFMSLFIGFFSSVQTNSIAPSKIKCSKNVWWCVCLPCRFHKKIVWQKKWEKLSTCTTNLGQYVNNSNRITSEEWMHPRTHTQNGKEWVSMRMVCQQYEQFGRYTFQLVRASFVYAKLPVIYLVNSCFVSETFWNWRTPVSRTGWPNVLCMLSGRRNASFMFSFFALKSIRISQCSVHRIKSVTWIFNYNFTQMRPPFPPPPPN